MPARPFLFDQSQAGCFHVVNRIYDRKYLLDTEGKDLLIKLVRAYEDVIGVEVLTFCIMDNHFHLLVRVPHRPEGFDGAAGGRGSAAGAGAWGGIREADAPQSGVLADDEK